MEERRSFVVRRARLEDIDQVIEVNMASLPERYWRGFYLALLESWGEAFLVAEVGGRVIGYAMSRVEETSDPVLLGYWNELESGKPGLLGAIKSLLRRPGRVGHLVSIAVLPGYRRRGVGSALLSETIRVLSEVYGVESIYLEVRVSNEPAIRLYEKFGFRRARRVRGYYADGEDAYVMVKRLKPLTS